MTAYRLSLSETWFLREAVHAEGRRCLEAAARLRRNGRPTLAQEFLQRAKELGALDAALEAGRELVPIPGIVPEGSGSFPGA